MLDCSGRSCNGGFKPRPTRVVEASSCDAACQALSAECPEPFAAAATPALNWTQCHADLQASFFPIAPAHVVPAGVPNCSLAGRSVRIALVHLMKTAGSTLYTLLVDAGVNFTQAHKHNYDVVTSEPFDLYIVSLRDPLNRTVSAFNYGHWSGGFAPSGRDDGDELPDGGRAARRFYEECFGALPGGLNDFAESLSNEDDSSLDSSCGQLARRAVHEIGEAYLPFVYIGGGLEMFVGHTNLLWQLREEPQRRVLVVNQESFEEDLERLWAALCVLDPPVSLSVNARDDFPRHNDTWRSAKGEANLRAALETEYYLGSELRRMAREREVAVLAE